MGISADGWVPLSEYGAAVQKHAGLREEMLRDTSSEEESQLIEKHWPWDDHDEDE
jgi:hypothetical protein